MTDIFSHKGRPFDAAAQKKRPLKNRAATPVMLKRKFDGHARRWREQTWFLSDSKQASENNEYQSIIGMGRAAVPLILKDLEAGSFEHWFIALKAISGEDPVPAEDRGKIDRMVSAWLAWGKRNGYVG